MNIMKYSQLLLVCFFIVNAIYLFGQSEKKCIGTDYSFIDKKESLSELLDSYHGKPVLVDIYSVYCSPCIKEFKHAKKVDDFLVEKGIKKLYIVYSKNFNDEVKQAEHKKKWKALIEKYDLQGDHYYLMNTDNLYHDIQKNIFQGKINLPWYVIVNKEGKIANRKASPCSKFKKLEKELEEIL